MIELPEATVIATQISQVLRGKRIVSAIANQSPHKFAWYTGDPAHYNDLLSGKTIGPAAAHGCHIDIDVDELALVLSTPVRYHAPGAKLPAKHQLLLTFDDRSALSATVQMWGALSCFPRGGPGAMADYYVALNRPSPLSDAFDRTYWNSLLTEQTAELPLKALLATEQRIPGLGNGVLQDILWTARLHPRRQVATLGSSEATRLFEAVKRVLADMVTRGGRDTERDLFDRPGGYQTILSRNTAGRPCPACGTPIVKQTFLGGSVYVCEACQQLDA